MYVCVLTHKYKHQQTHQKIHNEICIFHRFSKYKLLSGIKKKSNAHLYSSNLIQFAKLFITRKKPMCNKRNFSLLVSSRNEIPGLQRSRGSE